MHENIFNDIGEKPNIIVIMSDEHDPNVTGCYGNPIVHTPHLDRMAEEGIVFDRAYCNSPICVPSRMSFLTGKYAHNIGIWDLDSTLSNDTKTIGHSLTQYGYETVLCGRMHISGEDRLRGFEKRLVDDDDDELKKIEVPDRKKESRRWSNSHVTECGPGFDSNQEYDKNVANTAVQFLNQKANESEGRPWLLTVGFMHPHFPLIAPPDYYNMYDSKNMPMPDLKEEIITNQHPVIQQLRYFFRTDEDLPESIVRQALTSYYALITLTDHHIGMILDTVNHSALKNNTIIIYVSDHGEMAGQHGLWQKNCFYEPSVRIPMIMSIPGLPEGKRISENVSLVDLLPTLLELTGSPKNNKLDGKSVLSLVRGEKEQERVVFSEYHAQGMLNAGYMLVKGDWKYNYYVGESPQLFNIKNDPGEFTDLNLDPKYALIAEDLKKELFNIVDPEYVNNKAKADQDLRRKSRHLY